jgi:molybdenum cofactor cytidylyltransferase
VNPAPLVIGVVLAAGQSSRMGRPKALLPCPPDGLTFVATIVRTCRKAGVSEVLVVGRPDDDALEREVRGLRPRVGYVVNPDPGRGQLSSLVAGVDEAEARGAAAVLAMPVDIPLVRTDTFARVVDTFASTRAPIVRAAHRDRHGHPVIFAAEVFDALRSADPARGAKAVLEANASAIVNVPVDDPAVLLDVDAPADYEELQRRNR